MKNRIYFYANFGDWNKPPYGGGEVGNRKTLNLFKEAGFDVVTISKYKLSYFSSIYVKAYRVFANLIKYSFILLFGKRSDSVVHIAGFYGNLIIFEELLIRIAKSLGYRVVYELRGGGAQYEYDNGSAKYKKRFASAINNSDYIFSQGLENYELIHLCSPDKGIFYYPNYVTEDFRPEKYPLKPKDYINLVYFGRVSEDKHVDIVIDTFISLRKYLHNLTLSIIGNYDKEDYIKGLAKKIEEAQCQGFVKMLPACNHSELKKHLVDKHFFIFPSTGSREGHSNALTEAMAWGVIPVSSPQGFSRTVISNDDLIVEELDASHFAAAIMKCIENQNMEEISISMYNRVAELYTEKVALHNLKQIYETLFGQFTDNLK